MPANPIFFIQDLAMILVSAALCAHICKRIGLSAVVGYLLAGLFIGTPEVVFPYVTDVTRVEVIAQLGVVFLMFSIGLQFRLQRIKDLGMRVVIGTATIALLVLTAVRSVADILGVSEAGALAMAAIFMCSSSAIISKVLQEKGLSHDRHGQLAMGVTLLEDVVAVVMLAVLGSYLMVESGADARTPVQVVLLLVGFAVGVFIVGLLILPKVLNLILAKDGSESLSIFVAGLLLMLSLVAVKAGYSLALGAFLFGMIIAETRQRHLVERMFRGLKDLFLTVFFVTIGMMVDVTAIPGALKWILLGTLGAIVGRACAGFVSLVLIGEHPRTAMRAALCLTPIGEFSFIIAGFAVAGGLFSENFQVIAVGVALLTSILFPLLAQHSGSLSKVFAEGKRPLLERLHSNYRGVWKSLASSGSRGVLWGLLRKRIVQVLMELLILTTILIFADPLFNALATHFLGPDLRPGTYIVFWVVVGVLCLLPLVAVWRNLSAVALILADYSNRLRGFGEGENRLVSIPLQVFFTLLLILWMWNVLPQDLPRAWIIFGIAVFAAFLIPMVWRRLFRLHSEIEWTLDQRFKEANGSPGRRLFETWQEEGWGLEIEELTLPDDTLFHGKRLMDTELRRKTGCSVVEIERHGQSLTSVGPETHLFAGDQLLLLGTREQMDEARRILKKTFVLEDGDRSLSRSLLESLKVDGPPIAGKTLSELNWSRLYGVQIVAIRRAGETLTGLDSNTCIQAGDTLLILGPINAINGLTDSLAEN